MVNFDSLQLSEPVLRALSDMGFTTPSPIQQAVIPLLLTGRDAIGQAQTGTGKTAAFGIPLVMAGEQGRLGIVLVPTRELAIQVTGELNRIGKHSNVKALALYGGASFGLQVKDIERGDATIVVATPGRLRDHLARGTLDLATVSIAVLDEADEMLKMGFIDEVEEILAALPRERQMLLFSATMAEPIVRLAEKYLNDPEYVHAQGDNDSVTTALTEQFAVDVRNNEKLDVLLRIMAAERPTGILVFRHTREMVDELATQLRARRVEAAALHGGLAQPAREAVLEQLRRGRVKVVVATNVAARGLDVDTISHVVNYDAPREAEAYVHRIGRTGRAGRDGRSFLFVTPADRGRLRGIEREASLRLTWYEVPSDEAVERAVLTNNVTWLRERAANAKDLGAMLAIVDAAVEGGLDPRTIAAVAMQAAARHEGLEAPPLERRQTRSAPQRGPEREQRGAPVRHEGPRVAVSINVGREDGVRPGDLVGALANEANLTGGQIGRIDILPRMSVVEIPAERLEDVIETMRGVTIRGRNAQLRPAHDWRFRSEGQRPAPRARAPGRY